MCIDGPSFRKMSESEVHNILPRLQVLARSSPQDKKMLVEHLKNIDEVVAVTGDGYVCLPPFVFEICNSLMIFAGLMMHRH